MNTKNKDWVQQTWGTSNLGDKRRTKRAVQIAEKLLEKPHEGLPTLMGKWADLKAAYRLFNESDVTHEALQEVHWGNVKKEASNEENTIIWIQDGSELDYTDHEAIEGLGPINNYRGQGIMMHSTLAIKYNKDNPQILGLARQKAWIRENISRAKTETRSQRNKRVTESKVWSETIKAIGKVPSNCKWVNVSDRGSDIFEFVHDMKALNWDCVIRVYQNRCMSETYLLPWVRSLPQQAHKKIELRGRDGEPKKEIELKVSWGKTELLPPKNQFNKWKAIEGWYIRCWNEKEKLEWILYSSLPINQAEEAIEKIDWYKCRWIIEEYHKCLKTGCNIEKRQLRRADGLLALLGLFGIIATKLLQLRTISKEKGDTLAKESIPETMLKIVCARYKLKGCDLTLKEFWRRVAMLGGFLGRRSDGNPGWQTLWNGWLRLLDMWFGAESIKCG